MMNHHLTEEELGGYIQRTLTDAQRESLDQHLATCDDCRAHLTAHEAQERRLRHALSAMLNEVTPSEKMTFAALKPRLARVHRNVRAARSWNWLLSGATAATALAGLVLALATLIQNINWTTASLRSSSISLPAAASFLFMVPVLSQFGTRPSLSTRKIWTALLTFVLWAGTAIVGLYEILLLQELSYRCYARFWSGARYGQDYGRTWGIGVWSVFILAMVWIAVFIGGAEYHYKHVGQRSSWKWFGWTIAVELLILALPLLI
ncbi:MAG: zf-HC2 domain-containing protein [Anaerolineae bacterium]|nr:zf-HC2 domain-containing protein [Anaerolineae bacterium]